MRGTVEPYYPYPTVGPYLDDHGLSQTEVGYLTGLLSAIRARYQGDRLGVWADVHLGRLSDLTATPLPPLDGDETIVVAELLARIRDDSVTRSDPMRAWAAGALASLVECIL